MGGSEDEARDVGYKALFFLSLVGIQLSDILHGQYYSSHTPRANIRGTCDHSIKLQELTYESQGCTCRLNLFFGMLAYSFTG